MRLVIRAHWGAYCADSNERETMSTLAPPQWISELCEKHDLYEYRILILVTLPDGNRFITDSADAANRLQSEHGAETTHIVELGE
jgi:hypothetical protein